MNLQEVLTLALRHQQAGRLRDAEHIYRQVLAQNPLQPVALHHLGILAFQSGHRDAGLD